MDATFGQLAGIALIIGTSGWVVLSFFRLLINGSK